MLFGKRNDPHCDVCYTKIQEIDAIIKTAQVLAEERYKLDNKIISVMNEDQQLINELMKNGDVEGAAEVQQHNLESQKLLQMAK